MTEYRTGRKNGHTIYLQTGEKPDDNDPFVGSCVTPGHARNLARFATAGLAAEERLEAMEEIRQRVADGWSVIQGKDGASPYWSDDLGDPHFMPDSVAAVLWPSTEDAG